MNRNQQFPLIVFAIGMMGLGILALVYGDFALVWQPVPASIPGRTALAYASGIIMLLAGIGLLIHRTAAWSARILFPYLIIWFLLKVPAVIAAPTTESNWLGLGELGLLLAGGWVLFAGSAEIPEKSPLAFAAGESGIRMARILFGLSLLPIGLSHLVYLKDTADFVPGWLPYRSGWAALTGAGHIAAGLGILFTVLPRLAATMEAGMLSIFTILVWIPAIVAAPTARLPWTAFYVSWVFTAAAWVVASTIPSGLHRFSSLRRPAPAPMPPAPAP
jgi:uncharacterized membrane protein